MPMAQSWSFVPNDTYKSPRVLIQMLVDVVAKGGNLLLNIGPGPDGAWHDAAYDRLAALGAWMKVNSEAIYATRADRAVRRRQGSFHAARRTAPCTRSICRRRRDGAPALSDARQDRRRRWCDGHAGRDGARHSSGRSPAPASSRACRMVSAPPSVLRVGVQDLASSASVIPVVTDDLPNPRELSMFTRGRSQVSSSFAS